MTRVQRRYSHGDVVLRETLAGSSFSSALSTAAGSTAERCRLSPAPGPWLRGGAPRRCPGGRAEDKERRITCADEGRARLGLLALDGGNNELVASIARASSSRDDAERPLSSSALGERRGDAAASRYAEAFFPERRGSQVQRVGPTLDFAKGFGPSRVGPRGSAPLDCLGSSPGRVGLRAPDFLHSFSYLRSDAIVH
jgi:hypothetical protein